MPILVISFNFHMLPPTPWTPWQLRSTESSYSIPQKSVDTVHQGIAIVSQEEEENHIDPK